MPKSTSRVALFFLAVCLAALAASPDVLADSINTVFVISMENQNWTQPANPFTGGQQQVYQNSAAHFLNSLVGGTAVATVNGVPINVSAQTAYATAAEIRTILTIRSENSSSLQMLIRT